MFTAALDACVLVPSLQRDVLLEAAERGVYRAVWSDRIIEEMCRAIRTLRRDRDDAPTIDAYISRLTGQMLSAFPDALVTGWEALEAAIELPDPDDRHVVAAAIVGRADLIVTDNSRDFPTTSLPAALDAQSADEFLLDALDLHPETICDALRTVASRTGRFAPPMTPHQIAERLQGSSAPRFGAEAMRRLA